MCDRPTILGAGYFTVSIQHAILASNRDISNHPISI